MNRRVGFLTIICMLCCCGGLPVAAQHAASPGTATIPEQQVRIDIPNRSGQKRSIRIPILNKSFPNTIAIRGKVLPWVGLGSGINYSIGAEWGFRKVHAVGFEAVYNDHSSESERYDSSKDRYVSGPRLYYAGRGLFLYYRRYWRVLLSGETPLRPYWSAYLRGGNKGTHPEDGYRGTEIAHTEREASVGLLWGLAVPFELGEVGFDLNTGPFWKWRDVHDEHYDYNSGSTVVEDYKANGFGWRLGVNLIYFRKRGKL